MSPSAARTARRERIGRFELKRELGRGAQAAVWLAHDPRLERDVALKLLHEAPAEGSVSAWLHEARAVSRLQHPHIVPVFEADVHDGRPYLVFEHVAGGTLADRLKQGALPLREAIDMVCGVLDALQVAHEAGVVHRDLKPSNILLDAQGRARVMDFGIAARLDAAGRHAGVAQAGEIVGTPGYISPEAARGEPAAPSMDVFAAALMLAEMLSGQPVRARERDAMRAVRRAADEDVVLPASLGERADARLRAVLEQAVQRQPQARTASARALREALVLWLESVDAAGPGAPAVAAGATPGATAQGTLEFLWRRMRHKSDFPALGNAVTRIHRVASSESESLASLANEILKDVALTHKLLRLVNTANFSHAGGGSISTVSRAVALVGFAGIRNMALSLVLLEHMHDKAHAQQLTQEFLRALMAGTLAGELASGARESEEAFIGALFQNLGRLLAGFYFAEEAAEIRTLAQRIGEAGAATRVLGLDYIELGQGVARRWGLPDTLLQAMRRPAGEPPARRIDAPLERQRWLGAAANDMADALLRAEAPEAAVQIEVIADRHAGALGLTRRQVHGAVATAREHISQFVQGSSLVLAPQSPVRRLLASVPLEAQAEESGDAGLLAHHALQATVTAAVPLDEATQRLPARAAGAGHDATLLLAPEHAATATDVEHATTMLAAGIADITQSMVSETFKLNQVLRMILETMYRALGFSRVVFCLRDAKTDTLTGRFGLGEGVEAVSAAFKVSLRTAPGQAPDLFAAVCQRVADTLITDAHAAPIATRLPPWYRKEVHAGAFLLLPLALKQSTFAMIYADRLQAGALALGEQELSLLRTLRNQAVMAFRQVG